MPAPPKPVPVQQLRDDAAALQEAISDTVDINTLLETDDHLSYRRPGIGTDVTTKLRRGVWSVQRQIDLHGLRRRDAADGGAVLDAFELGGHQPALPHNIVISEAPPC